MKVDQALEDIVKQQLDAKRAARRASRPGGRGGGRRGIPRRRNSFGGGGAGRNSFSTSSNGAQKSSLFNNRRREGGGGRSRSPVKPRNEKVHLHISNLDFGVSERDLKELFGEFGDLKRADLHYEKGGRSLGTGELVFMNRGSAMKALKTYNGVPLDGRAMRLEVLGEPKRAEPVAKRLGAPRRSFSESPRKGGGGRGGGRGGGPRRGGRGGAKNGAGRQPREKKEEKTAEELDKELDKYLAAGNIN